MNKTRLENRIRRLKEMDYNVCNVFGDDSLWLEWIAYGVPDCPTEDDFRYIAEDDELYKECVELYKELKERAE